MNEIITQLDTINSLARENPRELIHMAEELYAGAVDSIASRVAAAPGRTVVMLAGPSSSGKTTTSHKIAGEIRELGMHAFSVSLDDFYLPADRMPKNSEGKPDFEAAQSLDLPLIRDCLGRLIGEGTADLPVFDFGIGRRADGCRHLELDSDDIIIVEGLHALNPLITAELPHRNLLKLYISVKSRISDGGERVLGKRDLRFIRRLVRDYKFRSSSADRTLALWQGVMHGENAYLFPFEDTADIKINSLHSYEPCVLKHEALPLLRSVSGEWAQYAAKLTDALVRFEDIPSGEVPGDSLLREFIGG